MLDPQAREVDRTESTTGQGMYYGKVSHMLGVASTPYFALASLVAFRSKEIPKVGLHGLPCLELFSIHNTTSAC
ncbi:unnamed protein product, partial [marine sediment metagenome]